MWRSSPREPADTTWDLRHRDHPWPGVVSAVGYRTPEPDQPVHYGLPSPWLTVIFSLDDGVESASDRAALASAPPLPIVAAGLHTRSSFVRQRPGQAGVQLAVHPLAARCLFGLPAAELSVTEYDGRQVLDRRATTIQQQLTECQDWGHAFALLGGHLARSLDRHHRVDVRSELRHAWSLLETSGGLRPIAEVAAHVGLDASAPGHVVHPRDRPVTQGRRAADPVPAVRGPDQVLGQPDRASGPRGGGGAGGLCRPVAPDPRLRGADRGPAARWVVEEFRNLQDHGAPSAA